MAPLTLTILGSSPAAPNPGGACSGYLLRQGDSAVLMDCGAGTAGRIALHVAPNRLQGVVISHLHPDHYFDVVQLYYMLKFGEPRYEVPGAGAERFIQPLPGRLVLFPSYMWHGTTAIHGDLPRMSIAFDVKPGER